MKIVQVMPEFGLAGAERMAENLILKLKEEKYDVEVVSLFNYHSDITDNLEKNDVQIHYLNKKKGMDLSIYPKLIKLFRRIKPDVVHTHRYVSQYTMPACVLAGVPVRVHTVHNMADKEHSVKKLQKIFIRRCNMIPVAISDIVRGSICSFYSLDKDKVPLVYNGVRLNDYRKKESYGVKDGVFRIMHVGRFSPQKNHKGLIEAFSDFHAVYPKTELYLYGDGELRPEIEALVKSLGMEEAVKFCGLADNINEIMCNYDMLALPSHYEGMPITLIEAMAVGMPIAAANVGGIPDMIKDKTTGILVEPRRDSIAKAIGRIYEDEELRERLGRNAAADSRKFSAENMLKGYIEIYEH